MNNFDSFRAITRRALWINYISPLVCMVPVTPVSGSGSENTSNLEIEPTVQSPGTVLAITQPDSASLRLAWELLPNAYAYVLYRATAEEGPFEILVAGVIENFWVDTPAVPGSYFYKVTGIEPDFGETAASNIVSGTIV